MSLWPSERVLIGLYPDRLLWLRHDARLRLRERHRAPVASKPGQPRWAAAVAALEQELVNRPAKRLRAGIVLSSHFVRYTLVPWSVHAPDRTQRCEMARYAFAQIHGSVAEGWSVQVSDGGVGAFAVASAVDRELLAALDSACDAAHVSIESVQPHLMAAFNRVHAAMGRRPHWFALVEPGALCLALLARGRWHRLIFRRAGEDWATALRALLKQEACLGLMAASTRDVHLYAPGMEARPIGVPGEWRVRHLSAHANRDQAVGPAVAVGG